ncbi:MAG: hypothetical protein WC389_08945 [Lutibacter sp.]|jgi:hypothetical protein
MNQSHNKGGLITSLLNELPHEERVKLQNLFFRFYGAKAGNRKFYDFCWKHLPHYCEECGIGLLHFAPIFISHILSKGAHDPIRFDIRNVNILCPEHHRQWETEKKEQMGIYEKNQETIEKLKHEYYCDDTRKFNN